MFDHFESLYFGEATVVDLAVFVLILLVGFFGLLFDLLLVFELIEAVFEEHREKGAVPRPHLVVGQDEVEEVVGVVGTLEQVPDVVQPLFLVAWRFDGELESPYDFLADELVDFDQVEASPVNDSDASDRDI